MIVDVADASLSLRTLSHGRNISVVIQCLSQKHLQLDFSDAQKRHNIDHIHVSSHIARIFRAQNFKLLIQSFHSQNQAKSGSKTPTNHNVLNKISQTSL